MSNDNGPKLVVDRPEIQDKEFDELTPPVEDTRDSMIRAQNAEILKLTTMLREYDSMLRQYLKVSQENGAVWCDKKKVKERYMWLKANPKAIADAQRKADKEASLSKDKVVKSVVETNENEKKNEIEALV